MENLPQLVTFYTQNKDQIDDIIDKKLLPNGEVDISTIDPNQIANLLSDSSVEKFMENIKVSPKLQALFTNFASAPGHLVDLLNKRMETHLVEEGTSLKEATDTQKKAAMKYAVEIFNNYGQVSTLTKDLFDGGNFDIDTYVNNQNNTESLPTSDELTTLEKKFDGLE